MFTGNNHMTLQASVTTESHRSDGMRPFQDLETAHLRAHEYC
jgi:hypothetical protein